MRNKENIKSVENRTERTHYNGVFKDFQTFGETLTGEHYSLSETESFTEYQNFLYKRAMFGLKMYTPEEIKVMHWQKRKRIQKVQQRAQEELNTWKQRKIITMTNKILKILFPEKSSIVHYLIEAHSDPDPKFMCQTSFKDLNISKEDIVDKLLTEGLLPHNFKTIK